MTFAGWTFAQIGPLLLAGSTAITVLYLLRMRRRQVVVPFAALWEQVTRQSESRRLWRKLRRLLSWLLQLLVLALIALALGDPRPEVWLRDPMTMAIVVDTSASMAGPSAQDPTLTRLDIARRQARQFLGRLGPADRAVVIEAGAHVGVAAPLSGDSGERLPGLMRLTARHGEADLERAIDLATHSIAQQSGPRIVVFTDGATDPPGQHALTQCVQGPLPCEVVSVDGPTDNIAITAFAARRYPYARDKIEVLAEVYNLGDSAATVQLSIEADGAPMGTRTLHLEAGEHQREVLHQLDAARTRLIARLRREDGRSTPLGLPHDDIAYAVVPPLTPLDVVLVSDGTNLFLEAALLIADDHIRLVGLSPEDAQAETNKDLAEADVVFFDIGDAPLMAPLPETHVVIFDPWRQEVSPSVIAKKANVTRPFLTEQDKSHPVLDHVVLKDVNIARGTTFVTEPGDQVLIRSLGEPLAVLREREHTTVVFGFDPRQSDLPLRTAFPMLIDNLLRYFEQREAGFVASVPLGTSRELSLTDLGLAPHGITRVEIIDPESRIRSGPVERGRFRLHALEPGFYTVRALDGPVAGTSVDLAVSSSSLEASDLHRRWTPPTESSTAELESSDEEPSAWGQGPLWSILMLGVAVLVALEWASYHRRLTV